jgi:hypothetical protein
VQMRIRKGSGEGSALDGAQSLLHFCPRIYGWVLARWYRVDVRNSSKSLVTHTKIRRSDCATYQDLDELNEPLTCKEFPPRNVRCFVEN